MSEPQLFSASDVIGLSLTAKQRANVRSNPTTQSTLIRTLEPGENTAPVFSYVNAKDGLWWQLQDNTFVKHNPKVWSKDKLMEQGAKPIEEKIKEEEDKNKTAWEKFVESLGGTFNKILIFGGFLIVANMVINKKK